MGLSEDLTTHPDAARIERAIRQRAYDDGYDDGRLDVSREHEARIRSMTNAASSLGDQVDYWRNLTNIANADVTRLRELLALQIEQAGEAADEAYKDGYEDGLITGRLDSE